MEEHHDFGYALRKEFWHKGIATEADKAVIGYTSLILMVMKIEFIKNIGIPLLYILQNRIYLLQVHFIIYRHEYG